ncbi:hypothetical protein GCM10027275_16650 [Rhabdobacter roseus]|uniref:Uncharacterized protein n=1 Tax=Rhabdobacter roseus TaxID=1655419 RepID=A0A840TPB8_9BACT|nr:hypothetical protein [Rhabdobacter roseus]MBB5283587.1 hypothetical protein [Rhabdobacter roseus]
MKKGPAYITILPGSSAHKLLIQRAVKTKDKAALSALKGRLNLPIHYVQNWFFYCMMGQQGAVVIFSASTRRDMQKHLASTGHKVSSLHPVPAEDPYEDIINSVEKVEI